MASQTPQAQQATVTVATFGALPLEGLLAEYQRLEPGVRLEVAGDVGASSHRTILEDELAASRLADVVLVRDSELAAVFAHRDRFADLTRVTAGADAFPWAVARGTDDTGRVLAAPVTIEPVALCFRADLIAEAGIAQDRDELAALLGAAGGGWDVYLDVGRQYTAATGRAWFDQPEVIWRAMVGQLASTVTIVGGGAPGVSPELQARWDLLTAAIADGLSAQEATWDWDGGRAFVDGSFATFPCPRWGLDLIERNVLAGGGDDTTGWDVADVLPGGGWSWGDVYVARSATAEHADEADALAGWLLAPEQQARWAAEGIGAPSDRGALVRAAADEAPLAFFDDAPVGPIFASRAGQVPSLRVDPEEQRLVLAVSVPLLHRLDSGGTDAATAWSEVVDVLTHSDT